MRFVSRILIGVAAATVVAIGAPVAANATATSAPSTTHFYDADWGPYFSSDHKAKASGHVTVDQKRFKHWFWKWVPVKKWECKKDHKAGPKEFSLCETEGDERVTEVVACPPGAFGDVGEVEQA
ncbi:hypothetical protein ACFLIM_03005 [Nonomuraea sp. M3C6]|uniref:Uncharacterized protein n=1 Tax=Nonomuraea marmarensis TaxID=3351344 RepID=A0ABW7A4C1_9ACTN